MVYAGKRKWLMGDESDGIERTLAAPVTAPLAASHAASFVSSLSRCRVGFGMILCGNNLAGLVERHAVLDERCGCYARDVNESFTSPSRIDTVTWFVSTNILNVFSTAFAYIIVLATRSCGV